MSPWRDRAATAIAVLAVVALFGANLAWWVSHDVYDTTAVTTKANALVASPDTRAAVTALLDEKVVQPALAQAASSLPGPLQSLGGAVQSQTAGLVHNAIADAVANQTVGEITGRLVADLNTQLVDGSGPITLTPTQLLAIVAPSLTNNRAVTSVVDLAEQSGCCTIVLAQRSDLPFVWQHVEMIRAAAIALPVAALGLGLLALVLARRRLRIGIALGMGCAIGGAIVLIARWAGIRWGVDLVGDPNAGSTAVLRQALRVTSDVTLDDLRRQSWVLVIAGSVVAVGLVVVATARRKTTQAEA
jgi:hypothetical protein